MAFKTGYHFLGYSSISEFDDYSIGISLYFKFLKNFSLLFFLFFLLTLPIIQICVDTFQLENMGALFKNQKNLIYGTSLGPIGENSYSC
jgi:flagellar biosynthesis protein FliR